MKLSVNKNTQGSSGVPLPAPTKLTTPSNIFKTGYEFPICRLTEVRFDAEKEVKRDEETVKLPVLIFVYKDKKDRQFTQIEFPIDEDDTKAEMKAEALQQRIKHIWDTTIGEDVELDLEGDGFHEFYKNTADAFNAQVITKDEKEIKSYTIPNLYIKLIYYKTNLQIPMYPNFLQRAGKKGAQLACETLIINLKRDNVEPSKKASNAGGYQGGLDNDFPGGDELDSDDFPDV